MRIKYYLQKLFGIILNHPIIPKEKTVGYSLVKSEKFDIVTGDYYRIDPPFFLHHVELGDYSYISRNSSVSNCCIGKFSSIGPNFCCGLGIHPTNGISTSPMFYSTAKQNGQTLCKENKVHEYRKTFIGNDVFIGANVTVLDGVHIGDGAVIGAGAVVTKDIPPYAIAVGVPARVMRYRFSNEVVLKLLKKQWWEGNEEDLQMVEKMFWDVEGYLND